jgi:hypothetical protein
MGSIECLQRLLLLLRGLMRAESVSLLVLGPKETEFLPGAKRLFSTLPVSPPQRNRALEKALTGREIFHTETDSNGSYSTTYTLRSDLSVFKESSFSSGEVSGSTDARCRSGDKGFKGSPGAGIDLGRAKSFLLLPRGRGLDRLPWSFLADSDAENCPPATKRRDLPPAGQAEASCSRPFSTPVPAATVVASAWEPALCFRCQVIGEAGAAARVPSVSTRYSRYPCYLAPK